MKELFLILIALTAIGASAVDMEAPDFSLSLDPAKLKLMQPDEDKIICIKPAFSKIFPKDADGNPLEGKVLLSLKIGDDGKPLDVRVSESSGNNIVDQAAVKNAKFSVFPEAKEKEIEKTFTFKLEKE